MFVCDCAGADPMGGRRLSTRADGGHFFPHGHADARARTNKTRPIASPPGAPCTSLSHPHKLQFDVQLDSCTALGRTQVAACVSGCRAFVYICTFCRWPQPRPRRLDAHTHGDVTRTFTCLFSTAMPLQQLGFF